MNHKSSGRIAPTVIGVIVATEKYLARARVASDQFSKWTGCRAVVLKEEDLRAVPDLVRRWGGNAPIAEHVPYLARLCLFDLLDVEHIVSFDADWICLRPWEPSLLCIESSLAVARDFWWNSPVTTDCATWGIDPSQYFNAGFMLLNRRNHAHWLCEAAALYGKADAVLREQTLLNSAAQTMHLPVRFLCRDYNLIEAGSSDELGAFNIIGAHLMSKFPVEQYEEFVRAYENRGTPSLPPEETGMAGAWLYDRVGLGLREIEFRPDGTIGKGSAGCERFWRVWHEYGRPMLGVFGNAGGEARVTMTFRAWPDGDGWHGRWLRFERCEVHLTRIYRDAEPH